MPKTQGPDPTLSWLNQIINKEIHGRSLEEAHAEAVRELTMRKKCYPRWIEEGRTTKWDAKDRGERLEAAVWFLEQLLACQKAVRDGVLVLPGCEVPEGVTSTGDKTGEPF